MKKANLLSIFVLPKKAPTSNVCHGSSNFLSLPFTQQFSFFSGTIHNLVVQRMAPNSPVLTVSLTFVHLIAANIETLGPASKALKWELRTFQNQLEITNPFKGPPRPELEEAWNKLLHPSAAILVDKESLDRINRTSVELQDGSGYMAALDVYHQLHCLVCIQYSMD